MRRRSVSGILALCGFVLAAGVVSDSWSAPLSKRYEFRGGVTLEVGVVGERGLRLDTVRFQVPAPRGDRLLPTGGPFLAEVAVSNTAKQAHMVGLAIALFDDEGHLLAVASGGNVVNPLRPDRQKTFQLVFEGVNAEAHKATTFQISLEAKP